MVKELERVGSWKIMEVCIPRGSCKGDSHICQSLDLGDDGEGCKGRPGIGGREDGFFSAQPHMYLWGLQLSIVMFVVGVLEQVCR